MDRQKNWHWRIGSAFALLAVVLCAGTTPERKEVREQEREQLVDALVNNLTHSSPHIRGAAIKALGEAKQLAAVPALIEIMRFESVFQLSPVATLEQLSGQKLGDDWGRWVEWLQGRDDIHPPKSFLAWKSNLYSRVDKAFENFLYPDVPYRIRLEEIVWGGVRKDGIPALTNPKHVQPNEATYLTPQELVFGVSFNGESRAYPLRILDWHEMFNDVVGGKPITLSY
ncbi:MAG: DUF3179 domain-containing protein [Deltaproteobacteria bacterium]|nr:DUF3179 domain-containing protein [Deltaproteobacteria bacterium]